MKIVDVIPVAKGVFKERLSYFTSKNVSSGALVEVPVKNKFIPAVVSSVFNAKEYKISVKDSSLSLKPVKKIISENFFTPEFLQACKEIAEYFVSTHGSVLKDFMPEAVLKSGFDAEKEILLPEADSENPSQKGETMLLQAPGKERVLYYRSIVREEFARNKSVFFCLPATFEMEDIFQELKRGIENYAILLNGKMPKKKIKEEWHKAIREKHPLLIVFTKNFLSLPRKDIGAIIVDQENSSSYKAQKQPYIDFRKASEIISKNLKSKLVFGDEFLRSETFYSQETGESKSSPAPASRAVSESSQTIIDSKTEAGGKWQGRKFSALSPELKRIIFESAEKKEKIIIFSNRRGHSPTTICHDCQRTILCSKCDTPMVLHKNYGQKTGIANMHICHKCLQQSPVPEQCPYCRSWRLEDYGIGTQMIAEELAASLPDLTVFRMDSDNISTDKKGEETAAAFYSTGGSVIVGTEMIFSYLKSKVENVAVASLDGLFTLPEFKINEKVFQILLKLKSLSKKNFLVQTRFPDHPIFQYILKGNITGFYKEELENRKRFQYPPFKTLIKIIKEDKNQAHLSKDVANLEKALAEWNPTSYQAFIPKIKNFYRRHILLKLERGTWPEKQKKLSGILSSLPPGWKIDVEPESLL